MLASVVAGKHKGVHCRAKAQEARFNVLSARLLIHSGSENLEQLYGRSQVRAPLLRFAGKFDAGHARHPDVGDQYRDLRILVEQLQSTRAIECFDNPAASAGEQRGHCLACHGLIADE